MGGMAVTVPMRVPSLSHVAEGHAHGTEERPPFLTGEGPRHLGTHIQSTNEPVAVLNRLWRPRLGLLVVPCVPSSPARRSPGSMLWSRQIQGAGSKPPCASPVSPEPCWGNDPAGTTTFQRTCHGSFPFPDHGFSRGTILVVGPPGPPVFHRTCPRATPCLSHLFPTEPSARVRSTWRLGPPGVRPGSLSAFPPRRPARLPALLPPVLSPLGLGAKTGTKIGTKIGATRRPPFRRGPRARPASEAGRPPGAPPPCRGCASGPSARLDNAFWPIHRRGLGAPGRDQGCPLWLPVPRWTRRTGAIHPAALSRLRRGVASRDQPPEEPSFFDSVFRRWTRLEFLGVGHGSRPCAATAQQPHP